MLVLANWGCVSYLDLDAPARSKAATRSPASSLSAAPSGSALRRQWPEMINTGITFFVIFLYTKFYDWWWEIMPKYLFFLVVGLTAILFLFIIKRLGRAAHINGRQHEELDPAPYPDRRPCADPAHQCRGACWAFTGTVRASRKARSS